MKFILRILTALVFSSVAALAQSGSPTKQSGNVTPRHATAWTTNGVIQDAGTAAVPYLSSIGTWGQGPTICAWSALVTSGAAQQLCLGATNAGGATITVQNYGTASALPLNIDLNGTVYQFPYTVGGIVGPVSSTSGDVACWNNSSGSLLADCGFQGSSVAQALYSLLNGSNLYASPTGIDTNNTCTNSGSPCTLKGACLVRSQLATFLQSATGSLQINLANGTYLALDGNNVLCTLVGNSGGSANILTILNGTSSAILAVPAGRTGIFTKDLGELAVNGGITITGGNGSIGISGAQSSIVDADNITWGTFGTTGIHYSMASGSFLNINGETLNANIYLHIAMSGAYLTLGPSAVNIPSALTWAGAFIQASGPNYLALNGSPFTGSGVAGTTGVQGILVGPGYMQNGGTKCASYFPGNSGCQVSLGFMDDANDAQTDAKLLSSALEGVALPVSKGGTNCSSASGTCLDNITGFASTGIVNRTGAGTYTFLSNATTVDGQTCTLGSSCQTAILAQSDYTATTWTPAITTTSTAGTPAYTTQSGSYEKLGRQITARFNITLSGWTGSPTGSVEISGLPAAAANVASDYGTCSISFYQVTGLAASNVGMGAVIVPNTSVIVLYQNSNTASTQVTAAQFGTTGSVIGFCSYHT